MSDISKIIGIRIRNYRRQIGLNQEELAELAGCHPTYIGQIERGEKNATIESILKITRALNIPLSKLFERIDDCNSPESSYPLMCYELILSKTKHEQEAIYKIIVDIDKYKSL